MTLQGQELNVYTTWQHLSQRQPRVRLKQVASALGLSETNVATVAKRLVQKGYLERLGYGHVRPRFKPSPVDAVHLKGTSRDALTLHVELTGASPRVLDDVQEAIDRLTWFKSQIENQMSRERKTRVRERRED